MSHMIRQTHLEFYRENKIAPVRYDLSDINAHLERRFSLYTKLGLPPSAFKNSKVLEVAAGTGHNSLYISQLMPAEYTLLEPNEEAVKHIHHAYSTFEKPHTIPEIINLTVEEYNPKHPFDIVLCENWLGTAKHELSLLKKISEMVTHNGNLVLTAVSPIGFIPNLLRRIISPYLSSLNLSFAERTHHLTLAFSSHLETLPAMTRSKIDWVQDNMINPAYFNLCLSIPKIIEQIDHQFDIIGSFPIFAEDWRWFKALQGKERQFNEQFLLEYWRKAHNFLDYRKSSALADPAQIMLLEQKALELLENAALHEEAHIRQTDTQLHLDTIINLLNDFINLLPAYLPKTIKGLREIQDLINLPNEININFVSNMTYFKELFGRETMYVSFIKVK